MKVVCSYCKTKIDKKDALSKKHGKYHKYYCCQDHMDAASMDKDNVKNKIEETPEVKNEIKKVEEKPKAKKERKPREKDPVYEEIADILGERTGNSALFREMKIWRETYEDNIILAYLKENNSYITNAVRKLNPNIYARIMYISAILKNSLEDFKRNMYKAEPIKIEVNCEIYEPTISTKPRRRGLSDIEDEV